MISDGVFKNLFAFYNIGLNLDNEVKNYHVRAGHTCGNLQPLTGLVIAINGVTNQPFNKLTNSCKEDPLSKAQRLH
jgi:hypothetical protein